MANSSLKDVEISRFTAESCRFRAKFIKCQPPAQSPSTRMRQPLAVGLKTLSFPWRARVDSKRNPPPLLSSWGDPLRELRTAFRVELGCCFRAAARNAQASCSVVIAEHFLRKVPRTMVTSSSASATESRLKNALYEFARTFLLSVWWTYSPLINYALVSGARIISFPESFLDCGH